MSDRIVKRRERLATQGCESVLLDPARLPVLRMVNEFPFALPEYRLDNACPLMDPAWRLLSDSLTPIHSVTGKSAARSDAL